MRGFERSKVHSTTGADGCVVDARADQGDRRLQGVVPIDRRASALHFAFRSHAFSPASILDEERRLEWKEASSPRDQRNGQRQLVVGDERRAWHSAFDDG